MNAPVNTAVKMPKLGDRPKRGIKDMKLTIINRSLAYRPHHQKTLLLDVLETLNGESTVENVVQIIEAREDLWKRLDTIQSPYNCVVYHAKQLADLGYIKMETTTAGGTTTVTAHQPPLAIIQYSNRRPQVEEQEVAKEDVGDVEALLGVQEERITEPEPVQEIAQETNLEPEPEQNITEAVVEELQDMTGELIASPDPEFVMADITPPVANTAVEEHRNHRHGKRR